MQVNYLKFIFHFCLNIFVQVNPGVDTMVSSAKELLESRKSPGQSGPVQQSHTARWSSEAKGQ